MADRRGTCRWCNGRIVLWSGQEFWEHWDTGFYMCADEVHCAEPK